MSNSNPMILFSFCLSLKEALREPLLAKQLSFFSISPMMKLNYIFGGHIIFLSPEARNLMPV